MLRIIGANVKTGRLKANLTQECLAELIGVHWQTISYIENGKFPFSVLIFARLSQALETSANRLLEGLPELDKTQADKIRKSLARKRQRR
jgi:DNA-binding XRE family transcriptional regulator